MANNSNTCDKWKSSSSSKPEVDNNCMFRSLWLAIRIFIVVPTFKANLCCKSHH